MLIYRRFFFTLLMCSIFDFSPRSTNQNPRASDAALHAADAVTSEKTSNFLNIKLVKVYFSVFLSPAKMVLEKTMSLEGLFLLV